MLVERTLGTRCGFKSSFLTTRPMEAADGVGNSISSALKSATQPRIVTGMFVDDTATPGVGHDYRILAIGSNGERSASSRQKGPLMLWS